MSPLDFVKNPLKLGKILWPEVQICGYQRDILQSVWNNDETFVVAGNMLGKDYVAAYTTLLFFLTRHPCRIVTTSVDGTQLEGVLWGEIRRFIRSSRIPLDSDDGGPLVVNHLHLRKMYPIKSKTVCGISYCLGRVAAKGEGMLGHHVADVGDGIPRTLFVIDEASGVEDINYENAQTWARRILAIGNAFPTQNFFRRNIQAGDRLQETSI